MTGFTPPAVKQPGASVPGTGLLQPAALKPDVAMTDRKYLDSALTGFVSNTPA